MHILMLNHNVAWQGGTFFRAYHFGRHLARRGHRITLLTISPVLRYGFRENAIEGIKVIETPDLFWGIARSGWDPWDTLNRIIYIRRRPFDLVHAFDSRPAVILPAFYHKTTQRSKLVLDWADWWGRGGTIVERSGKLYSMVLGPVETFFEEAFRTHADGNTVISQALYQRALSLGVSEDALTQIPQGSDIDRIRPLDKAKSREDLGLPIGAPLLGHLGVLQPKDAEFLFRTFEIIGNIRQEVRLLLIGSHKADIEPYKADGDSVIETGYIPYTDLIKNLAACDILLLPLRNTIASKGRWPSRLNDYLAVGRPIVACPVGDVADLFREHEIGILAPDDPEEFAERTLGLLDNEPLQEMLAINARRVATEKFSWELLTDRLEGFYYRVLSRS